MVQNRAIKAINRDLKKNQKALLVLATGLGKTETAMKIIEKTDNNQLWIVGRNNLLYQTAERFYNRGIHNIGVLNGSQKEIDMKITMSTVQTISKQNMLKMFKPDHFDTIWIDEAHHTAAKQYKKILAYFKNYKLVGLTATPDRPDSENIYNIFGKISYEKTFEEAQKLKILAKQKPSTILTDSVIKGIKTKTGDYSPESLDRLYTSSKRNQTIIKSYIKYAKNKVIKSSMKPKAICFCINVQHAIMLSKEFKNKGIKAEYICGNRKTQTVEDRIEIENKFRNTNDIEILCAVDLMNEGIDIPDVNIALMARPTRSAIIYSQQLGRVARIDGGRKKYFVVLDYVDNCGKDFNSYTIGNLKPNGSKNIPIITEYLNQNDPEHPIKNRVKSYRDGLNNFTKSARENYEKYTNNELLQLAWYGKLK